MARQRIEHSAADIAEAHQMYLGSQATLREIAEFLNVDRRTLRGRIIQWGWGARPAVRGMHAVATSGQMSPQVPPALPVADRIRLAVEREIASVTRALDRIHPGRDVGDSERTARVLGSLVKLLKESRQLRTDEPEEEGAVDYDELRREIARRLQGLLDERAEG